MDKDATMSAIRVQLQTTISSLQNKKERLLHHKKQYTDLSFTLDDHTSFDDTHRPEIQVRIGTRALARATVTDPKKILVLLGEDYYAERDPTQAKRILKSRLSFVEKNIKQFSQKIEEAQSTLQRLDQLAKIEASANDPNDGKFNEEGLPFLDIREELDEEGKVIASTLGANSREPNKSSKIEDVSESDTDLPTMDIIEELDENGNVISSSVTSGQGATSKLRSHESVDSTKNELPAINIREELDDHGTITKSQVNEEDADMLNKYDEEINQLYSDLGIDSTTLPESSQRSKRDELISKLDSLKIKEEDKQELKAIISEKYKTDMGAAAAAAVTDTLGFNKPAIAVEDILRLEVIADDFVQEEDLQEYDDDEEWDFEFDDDEQDDDDDDDAHQIPSMVPGGGASLFWQQIMKNRKAQNPESEAPPPVIANEAGHIVDTEVIEINKDEAVSTEKEAISSTSFKKSVRFAPSLEIKEIENISEELKQNQQAAEKMSRFKQERLNRSSETESLPKSKFVNPVSDVIVERMVDTSKNSIEDDINPMKEFVVERTIIEEPITHETETVKPRIVSRFKKELNLNPKLNTLKIVQPSVPKYQAGLPDKKPVDGIVEPIANVAELINQSISENEDKESHISNNGINENIISDITEGTSKINIESDNEDGKPKRVSKFKSMRNEKITNKIVSIAKEPIVEVSMQNKPQVTIIDSHAKPKKVSKFKSIRNAAPSKEEQSLPSIIANSNRTKQREVINSNMSHIDVITEHVAETYSEDTNEVDLDPELLKPKRTSRFKLMRNTNTSSIPRPLGYTPTRISAPTGVDDGQPDVETDTDEPTLENDDIEVLGATLDYQSLQDDMDTMAKAYVLGMYDDDILTEGPVVDKIEDFELLNKMIESMNKPEPKTILKKKISRNDLETTDDVQYDPEEGLDKIDREIDVDEEDDGPILADEIVENDFNYDDEHLNDDDFSVDQEFISQEVSVEYHRMRQNIIAKANGGFATTDKEEEFEPLDDDGSQPRVSRFKASKLQMRK